MDKYRKPTDSIVTATRSIDERLSKIERLPRLANSTVEVGQALNILGNFRVFDSEGRLLLECGTDAAEGASRFIVYHPDGDPNPNPANDPYAGVGSQALGLIHTTGNDPTNFNDMSLWATAKNGNPIFAESGDGTGLGVPYKHYFGCPTSQFNTPTVTTTSASYAAQWTVHGRYHHPHIEVIVRVLCSDGSTGGSIRLRDSFSPNGFASIPQTIANGANAYMTLIGDFDQNAGYAPFFKYEVDVLRSSGTGTIGTQLVSAEGYGDI